MKEDNNITKNYDVIVVGAGGAGLTAALTAVERGAQTLLLEKNEKVGGTTRIAVGSVSAAGTSLQKQSNIKDNAENFKEDMVKFIDPSLADRDNSELREILSQQANDAVEWLQKQGVSFVGPFEEPPNRVPRMHNAVPTARAYIGALLKQLKKQKIDIWVNSQVTNLLKEKSGKIYGVTVKKNNSILDITCKQGVILSTGDYSNSSELKSQYLSKDEAKVPGLNKASTGDGHKLGEEAGGKLIGMDVVLGPGLRFEEPKKLPILEKIPSFPFLNKVLAKIQSYSPMFITRFLAKQMLTVRTSPSNKLFGSGAILVNSKGEKFVDELSPGFISEVAKQPMGQAYIILDKTIANKFSSGEHFISTAPGIAYAYWNDYVKSRPDLINSGRTLKELASTLGISNDSLETTIKKHNDNVNSTKRKAISSPPYYSLGPVNAVFTITEGALKVNSNCQVLKEDSSVIEGLYAAGCVGQGGLFLGGHGTHIIWAIISGRIAGEQVTKNNY